MGFCVDEADRYDVFLSYASADDTAHNGWVADFEQYLRQQVVAELRRQGQDYGDDPSRFAVCRDITGFPEGGDLAEVIDEKVRHSQFLFIFLGSGYLNSPWCLSELDLFRENVGGSLPEALKRLYLIVLDREAIDSLREGDEPRGLPARRARLWQGLQSVTQKAIRIESFLQADGELLPVYHVPGRADPGFHKGCGPLVKELTRKLIAARAHLRPDARPTVDPGQGPSHIAIGAVPGRLIAARASLVEGLRGAALRVIEEADLTQPEQVRACLAGARLLVQPFDRGAPILVRGVGDPQGGHLGYLKDQFEAMHADPGAAADHRILWWEPPDQAAPATAPLTDYDRPFIDALDQLPADARRHCTAPELAQELGAYTALPLVTARVWIEWSESDEQTIEKAQAIIREHFEAYCRSKEAAGVHIHAALHFGVADWLLLERQLRVKPDGVVIVYNDNKDPGALIEQTQTISNLEEVLSQRMFPGLFIMRQSGMFLPSEAWSVVRLRLRDNRLEHRPEELQGFVIRLFDVLYNKYR